ncbi:MAG TPA: pyrimidine dimer DNA glycosylase/endonuclease V [Candidatus Binatia bacterium]|nr:pyrimidine dimer DNA glycosylase/endonuclease V [Candidatus Binatia bacterium]
MRLWSLHPRYLDGRGLVALWREGLLAQAVLAGRTRGYRHHPQLERFREAADPPAAIAAYLHVVAAEGARRGYRFDVSRIRPSTASAGELPVTVGQLRFEWAHLRSKLASRDPAWLARLAVPLDALPDPHPLFVVRPGPVASWERGTRG